MSALKKEPWACEENNQVSDVNCNSNLDSDKICLGENKTLNSGNNKNNSVNNSKDTCLEVTETEISNIACNTRHDNLNESEQTCDNVENNELQNEKQSHVEIEDIEKYVVNDECNKDSDENIHSPEETRCDSDVCVNIVIDSISNEEATQDNCALSDFVHSDNIDHADSVLSYNSTEIIGNATNNKKKVCFFIVYEVIFCNGQYFHYLPFKKKLSFLFWHRS